MRPVIGGRILSSGLLRAEGELKYFMIREYGYTEGVIKFARVRKVVVCMAVKDASPSAIV